jgi:hypothetical protein
VSLILEYGQGDCARPSGAPAEMGIVGLRTEDLLESPSHGPLPKISAPYERMIPDELYNARQFR